MKFDGKIFLEPFSRISEWLWEKLPDKEKKNRQRTFTVHKWSMMLAILFWGTGLCILLQMVILPESQALLSRQLTRPSYGAGDAETELSAMIEGETEKSQISVEVSERKYTEEEVDALFQKLQQELPKAILGENESLDEVRYSLVLPTSLEDGTVSVEWFFEPVDMIDNTGEIIGEPEETGTLTEVCARMSCQEKEEELRFFIKVFPPKMTREEELENHLLQEIKEADKQGIYSETIELPDQVDGKKINWERGKSSLGGMLFLLVVAAAVFLGVREDENLRQTAEKRRRELLMDYPEMLYKLTTLLRAGLTIQASFLKTAGNYKEEKEKNHGKEKYVYEEMLYSCNEMQSGVPEAAAYENFGQRCEIPAYVKLGSLLSQNLKKGSKGLAEILEKEAAVGMEERRNMAKKLGEEAGTKLLFPMMLMLLVVLAILMVPAMIAF